MTIIKIKRTLNNDTINNIQIKILYKWEINLNEKLEEEPGFI